MTGQYWVDTLHCRPKGLRVMQNSRFSWFQPVIRVSCLLLAGKQEKSWCSYVACSESWNWFQIFRLTHSGLIIIIIVIAIFFAILCTVHVFVLNSLFHSFFSYVLWRFQPGDLSNILHKNIRTRSQVLSPKQGKSILWWKSSIQPPQLTVAPPLNCLFVNMRCI